jgi:hypothetical protein
MFISLDDSYKQTKRIKIDGTPIGPPFAELAEWIAARFEVHVLNVILEKVAPGIQRSWLSRLTVMTEWPEEERKIGTELAGPLRGYAWYDESKQREIRERFALVVDEATRRTTEKTRFFTIFTAFEPLAKREANWRITDGEIANLQLALKDDDLWTIRRSVDSVTFFLYTDAQVKAHQASGAGERFARAYARVAAPYDEFGYLAKQPISVTLDSKEMFDNVFHSNWSCYDKG